MHRLLPSLAGFLILLGGVSHADISVPSPSNSSVPGCLVFCPAGDSTVRIVVRDFANNPIAGSMVVLDFSACDTFVHCPVSPSDPYLIDDTQKTIRRTTDANGVVLFPVRMGGTCHPVFTRVYADGVLLRYVTLATFDQDGDLQVSVADQALAQTKVGTFDGSADFDCDLAVTAADVALVGPHIGHVCEQTTTVRHPGWGRLKVRYR